MNESATLSEETKSTNLSGRRSLRMRKQTQVFDVDQYARSGITPKSRTGPGSIKSVLKSVVQTAKKRMEKSTVRDSDSSKMR